MGRSGKKILLIATSVQSLSRVGLCDPMNHSTPGLPVHQQLPEFTQIHVHQVSDAIQPFHLPSSPFPPTWIFPSIRVFSNDSIIHNRWPRNWNFSLSVCPSNKYSGLISFRIDWLDFLAVQGTLKSLLQHHVQKHQFFSVQFSLWSNSHIHT